MIHIKRKKQHLSPFLYSKRVPFPDLSSKREFLCKLRKRKETKIFLKKKKNIYIYIYIYRVIFGAFSVHTCCAVVG